MKLFEELVAALVNKPAFNYGGTFGVGGSDPMKIHSADNSWLKDQMLEHIPNCHLFVLSMGAIFPMAKDSNPENTAVLDFTATGVPNPNPKKTLDLDVAPPFQTCWFQFAEPGSGRFSGIKDRHDGRVIYGMFLHETAPHEYLFAFIMRDDDDPTLHRYRFGHATQLQNHEIWHTISIWLQPFSKDATTGTMKTSSRVKFKDPATGEKILHKIKKVVMVFPKQMSAEAKKQAERDGVDFSHRFSVRGHWRKIAGIGKNRADEYVVSGFTYVREHEKGPEHLPVTKKTRVVPERTTDEQ